MGTIEKHKDGIMYYEIKGFNKNLKVKEETLETSDLKTSKDLMLKVKMNHLFTSRIGWNQEDIFKDMSKVMNIPEDKIYRAKQVHGTDILVIKDQSYKDIAHEKIDGLITNVKGIALATYHADCVPIYYYDPKKEAIGLAHGGWKGTLNNISKTIIEGMIKEYGSKVEDIIVAIGPSIGVCCYEIQNDLVKVFLEKYPNNKDIVIERDEKIYLDLWKINMINLIELGIKEENIYNSNLCTSCRTDKLYSYRKEKGTKNRMIATIGLNQ